jgi:hypothetical protein
MSAYHSPLQKPSPFWQEFYAIFSTYNRRRELSRLRAWAMRECLSAPLRLYLNRLVDEEKRLLRYRLEHPQLSAFAYLLHVFAGLLFPAPRFMTKGSAQVYRVGYAG